MKNEFTLAFNEIIDDKQLPKEVVLEAVEAAMISAYRKTVNASNAQHVIAKIDPDNGKVRIFAEKEVVEEVNDERTEVTLEDARKENPEAEIGNVVMVETTPHNFGRVAAQAARQVIQQKIREAEREAQFKYFSSQVGEIINGIVQAINPSHVTLGLDKQAEGIMPRKEQIKGERFHVHDRVRALLYEVKQSSRGPQIILSRAHRNFLRRLLEDEVPEIYHGQVEIRSIAREPGQRSKVAVSALQPGIDPVGACVGVRGVRIQAIVRELNDEKIDVIEWNPDPAEYIAKALSPARVIGVFLEKNSSGTKTATVVVPEDQLSLAIGRDGQNARLGAKLTSWRIDIKSVPEAAADALYKLEKEPEYSALAEAEKEIIPRIESALAKKAEGRPLTPEEYKALSNFINRVERKVIEQRESEWQAEKEKRDAIRATIPEAAFKTPLEDVGISPRFSILLSGEGYPTIGDLMFQMEIDSDAILALNGIGPKAMESIRKAIETYKTTMVAEEPSPEEEVEAAAASEVSELEAESAEPETAQPSGEELPISEAEGVQEPVTEAMAGEQAEEGEAVAEEAKPEEEPAPGLEELFKLPEAAIPVALAADDEDEVLESGKKKKKKRKKRFVEVEYDPDLDITMVKRKRKRSSPQEWMEDLDDLD